RVARQRRGAWRSGRGFGVVALESVDGEVVRMHPRAGRNGLSRKADYLPVFDDGLAQSDPSECDFVPCANVVDKLDRVFSRLTGGALRQIARRDRDVVSTGEHNAIHGRHPGWLNDLSSIPKIQARRPTQTTTASAERARAPATSTATGTPLRA